MYGGAFGELLRKREEKGAEERGKRGRGWRRRGWRGRARAASSSSDPPRLRLDRPVHVATSGKQALVRNKTSLALDLMPPHVAPPPRERRCRRPKLSSGRKELPVPLTFAIQRESVIVIDLHVGYEWSIPLYRSIQLLCGRSPHSRTRCHPSACHESQIKIDSYISQRLKINSPEQYRQFPTTGTSISPPSGNITPTHSESSVKARLSSIFLPHTRQLITYGVDKVNNVIEQRSIQSEMLYRHTSVRKICPLEQEPNKVDFAGIVS